MIDDNPPPRKTGSPPNRAMAQPPGLREVGIDYEAYPVDRVVIEQDVSAIIECRNKGGTATLCGHSEFADASTPPKKFRILTLSGEWRTDIKDNSACSGPNVGPTFTELITYSGAVTYSETTCTIESDTGAFQVYRNGVAEESGPTSTAVGWLNGGSGCNESRTDERLTRYDSPTGACCLTGNGQHRIAISVTRADTLSYEDTEGDAITRLLAGAGGTWSDWTTVGDGTGGTCIDNVCCLAEYEERTAGFSFAYAVAEYRVTLAGLNPSTSYDGLIDVYRRERGSSIPYGLHATLKFSDTTDGSGNFEFTDEVPNGIGYETYVTNARILT